MEEKSVYMYVRQCASEPWAAHIVYHRVPAPEESPPIMQMLSEVAGPMVLVICVVHDGSC